MIHCGPEYGPASPRQHRPPKVRGGRGYERYRNCLRLDFSYTCVYCLSTEREVGPGEACGGHEVEHFLPKGISRFRKQANHYFNLLWACKACNRAKGGRWPTDEQVSADNRFLDPTADNMNEHLELAGDAVIAINASRPGAYTISRLKLNSELHKNRRRERKADEQTVATLQATLELFESAAAELPADSELFHEVQADLQRVRDRIREKLRATPPWDAVDSCLCSP